MTIESQSGAAHYRLSAVNPCIIEEQPAPRLRWRVYARYRTAAEAQAALWRLARGEMAEQQRKGDR